MREKPTILLLSDDFDAPSGIGTQSRLIIKNSLDRFNWVQLGASTNHPDDNKRMDFSETFQKETGIEDASVIKYGSTGYGDPQKLRRILDSENIDGILHFTDPRFWTWLYQMEYEIHMKYEIPLMYYAIWDNYPFPYWNIGAYSSCDLIMGISKQSHLIHETVLNQHGIKTHDLDKDFEFNLDSSDVLLKYIPHGVDPEIYYPIQSDEKYIEFVDKFKAHHDIDFIFYWSNRNIIRKNPAQLILAFDAFRKSLPKKQRNKVALVMHTIPVDGNGTDLPAVHQSLAPNSKVIFIPDRLDNDVMNYFYNLADVTVNVASNEGFGLSSLESLMAGTPIINLVTGGLQDQCGFRDDDGKWFVPSLEIPSNHTGIYKEHGEWAFPIYPKSKLTKGSVQTPYIFDDVPDIEDIANALMEAYNETDTLEEKGLAGREWVCSEEARMTSKHMGEDMADAIQDCIDTFTAAERYSIKEHEIIEFTETGIIL